MEHSIQYSLAPIWSTLKFIRPTISLIRFCAYTTVHQDPVNWSHYKLSDSMFEFDNPQWESDVCTVDWGLSRHLLLSDSIHFFHSPIFFFLILFSLFFFFLIPLFYIIYSISFFSTLVFLFITPLNDPLYTTLSFFIRSKLSLSLSRSLSFFFLVLAMAWPLMVITTELLSGFWMKENIFN